MKLQLQIRPSQLAQLLDMNGPVILRTDRPFMNVEQVTWNPVSAECQTIS